MPLTPSEVVFVSLGQVQELHAVVPDQLGRDLPGLPLEWSIEDNTIVSLESDGRFRALANGTNNCDYSSSSGECARWYTPLCQRHDCRRAEN